MKGQGEKRSGDSLRAPKQAGNSLIFVPTCLFFLLISTGVGKTVSKDLFDDENNMARIDVGVLRKKHSPPATDERSADRGQYVVNTVPVPYLMR